ncbi:hypothetical protein FSP39_005233 [Pinctada imbricata]|uniref:Uncharacterized protein n=1 Tax=Pinctada imbricata TaxID=66713 RepID=A0AA89BNN7_PINIB|nr:hypothetical protein FSP39_005233 [Pinctada imbricata]
MGVAFFFEILYLRYYELFDVKKKEPGELQSRQRLLECDSESDLSDIRKDDSKSSTRLKKRKATATIEKFYKADQYSVNASTECKDMKACTESQTRTAPTKPPRIKLIKPSFEEVAENEKF